MKKHTFKKVICFVITAATLMTCAPLATTAQSFGDVNKAFWASDAIEKWSNAEVLKGFNGNFRPNEKITRAEFAVLLNKLMKYDAGKAEFSDVKPTDWFYEHISALAAAGVLSGSDGKAMPNEVISRQDAAVLLTKAFNIKKSDSELTFNDTDKISEYAKKAVAALLERKFVSGKPGNTFDPTGGLTRAEAAAITSNIVPNYIYKPGTYTKLVKGNVLVNCSDVIIKDTEIAGDLIVAPGVKDKVTLSNTKVSGSKVVLGKAEVKDETIQPSIPSTPSAASSGSTSTGAPEPRTVKYTYDYVLNGFAENGATGLVKQYIKFLKDPTYTPSNNLTQISNILTNAKTFVNKDFTIKPSVFPTLESVSSSVLKNDRKTLWLGYTTGGVDCVDLESNAVTSYTADYITTGKVLLIVDDTGSKGVWVITEDGVTYIK
jgi:hypothetical protein